MLDRLKLERLREASAADDWAAAADVCLKLSLESKGTKDEFNVEELALTVRLKDAERLAVIIDELIASE
jgi:hypothetical protein